MTRVAVVGAGMVGATTAARIAEARLCDDVALIDVAGDLARAMALDIGSSLPLLGSDTALSGGEGYEGARAAPTWSPSPRAERDKRPEPRRPARGQRPHRRRGVPPRCASAAPDAGRHRGDQSARRDDHARTDAPSASRRSGCLAWQAYLDTARFITSLAERAGALASAGGGAHASRTATRWRRPRRATIGGRPAGGRCLARRPWRRSSSARATVAPR